jgi:hypothetical protein
VSALGQQGERRFEVSQEPEMRDREQYPH